MSHEEIKGLIMLKETFMMKINEDRKQIADLKQQKTDKKADAWWEAEGTAKQKEDSVRASVSDLTNQIEVLEASIELSYNQIKILDDKIELEYLSDE